MFQVLIKRVGNIYSDGRNRYIYSSPGPLLSIFVFLDSGRWTEPKMLIGAECDIPLLEP